MARIHKRRCNLEAALGTPARGVRKPEKLVKAASSGPILFARDEAGLLKCGPKASRWASAPKNRLVMATSGVLAVSQS